MGYYVMSQSTIINTQVPVVYKLHIRHVDGQFFTFIISLFKSDDWFCSLQIRCRGQYVKDQPACLLAMSAQQQQERIENMKKTPIWTM